VAGWIWFGAIWLGPVRFFPAGGVRSGWVRVYLVRFVVAGVANEVGHGMVGFFRQARHGGM
jgi:hypothetical protein